MPPIVFILVFELVNNEYCILFSLTYYEMNYFIFGYQLHKLEVLKAEERGGYLNSIRINELYTCSQLQCYYNNIPLIVYY